jgi:hypothetical protein
MALDSEQRENLREIVGSAIVQTSTDGTSTSFDLEFADRKLQEADAMDLKTIAEGRARPPVFSAKTRFQG